MKANDLGFGALGILYPLLNFNKRQMHPTIGHALGSANGYYQCLLKRWNLQNTGYGGGTKEVGDLLCR